MYLQMVVEPSGLCDLAGLHGVRQYRSGPRASWTVRHRRRSERRHRGATLALKSGIHPKVVQERLGHATINVTLDTYSHVTAGMQRDAAEAIAAIINGPV